MSYLTTTVPREGVDAGESTQLCTGKLLRMGRALAASYRSALAGVPSTLGHGSRIAQAAVETLSAFSEQQQMFAADLMEAAAEDCTQLSAMQEASRFSDLQLVIHRSEDVIVELLFWMTGTTSVHDHAFAGAFMVVDGRSLHVDYQFEKDADGTRNFATGTLYSRTARILRRGTVCAIEPGSAGTHSVFHLDAPSVTLLIRTPVREQWWPQYEYRGGSIAVNSGELAIGLVKRIQALKLLAAVEPERFRAALCSVLEKESPEEAYWMWRSLDSEILRLAPSAAAAAREALHAGAAGFVIEQAIAREKAVARLVGLRRHGGAPAQRELLAMMMNLGDLVKWREVMRGAGESALSGISMPALEQCLADILVKAAPQASSADGVRRVAELLHPLLATPQSVSDAEAAERSSLLRGMQECRHVLPLLAPSF